MAIIPIKDTGDLRGKMLLVKDNDYTVDFCSEDCLLKTVAKPLKVVNNGQTSKTLLAAMNDDYLYLPIEVNEREVIHPLGEQKGELSRQQIWSLIKDLTHPSLMKVDDICKCTAKVRIVFGIPLLNIGTMPAWQKISNNVMNGVIGNNVNISFSSWKNWMGDLSSGLYALHKMNIYHGDTYPFNVVIEDDKAIWIDYSHITDDHSYKLKDIYAFLFYTCFYSALHCEYMSSSLITDILNLLSENIRDDQFLNDLEGIFRSDRGDVTKNNPNILKASISQNYHLLKNADTEVNEFFYKGLLHYYESFISWMQASIYLKDKNEIIKLQAEMKEREMKRLMVPKGELDAAKSDLAQSVLKLEIQEEKNFSELTMISQQLKETFQVKSTIEKENDALKHALQKVEFKLAETSKDYFSQEEILVNELTGIYNDLMVTQSLKSHKVSRITRIMKHEYKLNGIKGFLKVLKKATKFVNGKKGFFSEYSEIDPLYKVTSRIQNLNSQINTVNGYDEVYLQPEVFPEIRKVKSPTLNKVKRVAYFTNQLLDWFDQRPRYGGGERYCISLANLMKDNGLQVDIFQIAPTEFEGEYYGYTVKALKHGEFYSEFNIDGANAFYEISLGYDHVMYNMPELSAGKMRTDAISITHGIWFDHNNYGPAFKFREKEWFKYLHKAYTNPAKIVSVDTNSINVIRSLWPEMATKMKFIPNFVDHSNFSPPTEKRNNKKLKILFPRRSQINRGSRILEEILSNIPYDVEIYWVGEGDTYDTELIRNLTKKDTRLHFEKDADFDEMQQWYRNSDIVVIPTIACEGTSLSCIEALASGCATISTNVGGLTDIIQDGYNGRCVDPDPIEIALAINELIENKELMEKYQQVGYQSSFAFSLENWKRKWKEIFMNEGWINNQTAAQPKGEKNEIMKLAIVTKNAYHGGVESLIKIEQDKLNATVYVAGGLNNPEGTCPFSYKYVDTYENLVKELKKYDAIIYHWLYDWAIKAVNDSGTPSIEFVHRTDTADGDKTVPNLIVTHSGYVADYIKDVYNRPAVVIPNVVDIDKFVPRVQLNTEKKIALITSYYKTKGVDLFIQAWSMICAKYPDYTVQIYGKGEEEENLKQLANDLNVNVIFNGPTKTPESVLQEVDLVVTASRVEGLPVAVIEALACNVPIIASDIEGHKVFNDLAHKNGLYEPLILFRSEDIDDLANTLDHFLQNLSEYQYGAGRALVEREFSPDLHINKLKNCLSDIADKKKPNVDIYKIEESVNNGELLSTNNLEGFYTKILLDDNQTEISFDSSLKTSFESFICYRYPLSNKTMKISFEINTSIDSYSNVFVQTDWLAEDLKLIQTGGNGQYIDNKSNKLFDLVHLPESDEKPKFLDIIIRPNPDESFIIKDIKIISYA